ncbi:MAG TPA: M14 family zinc carboxypeptidase, partial [Gemmatimonadales bacterium]
MLRRTLLLLVGLTPALSAQALPRTTAERTNYTATSTSADVGVFLDSLELAGLPVTVTAMGTSAQGRPIYLVIASDPGVTSAAEAKASGKLVVYVQANIHAGEVEGKEA